MASASSVVEADFGEGMLPLVTAQDLEPMVSTTTYNRRDRKRILRVSEWH